MDLVSSVRYRFGFISDMVVFTVFLSFLMLTNSGVSLADRYAYSNYKALLLYGYIAWMLAIAAISTASNEIKNELQRGTFYLKLNSKYSVIVLYLGKLIATIIIQIFISIGIAIIARLLWNISLIFNFTIVIVLIVSTFGMFGIGLLIAGIQLLYKRTGAITLIVQMGLLFITDTLPTNEYLIHITKMLPLTLCNEIIRNQVVKTVDLYTIISLIVSSCIWLGIGIAFFQMCLKKAKKKGTLLMY